MKYSEALSLYLWENTQGLAPTQQYYQDWCFVFVCLFFQKPEQGILGNRYQRIDVSWSKLTHYSPQRPYVLWRPTKHGTDSNRPWEAKDLVNNAWNLYQTPTYKRTTEKKWKHSIKTATNLEVS